MVNTWNSLWQYGMNTLSRPRIVLFRIKLDILLTVTSNYTAFPVLLLITSQGRPIVCVQCACQVK